jgi:hypothetical protein
MSSFTKIKTSIRDAETMYRVLCAIPGAVVERDKKMMEGVWSNREKVDFVVNCEGSSGPGILGLVLGRLKYFCVYRGAGGAYQVEIMQEQRSHDAIERAVKEALSSDSVGQAKSEESARLAKAASEAEAQRGRDAQELGRRAAEAAAAADARRKEGVRVQEESRKRTAAQAAEAREEAARVLAKLDHSASSAVSEGSATQGRSGAGGVAAEELERVTGSLNQAIAQEYAKQKILDQLDDVQSRHGVSLSGIETLADGTIEITLQG